MEDKIITKLNKYKTSIELFLAFSIFVGLAISGTLFKDFTFFEVLSAFLSFIILVEVIRMLGQYIVTNHISVTLMVEMVIIFFCRDILLVASEKDLLFEEKAFYISFFIFIIFCFIRFRTHTLKHSKLKEEVTNCVKCDKKGEI